MEQRWHHLSFRLKRHYKLAEWALAAERCWAASAPLFWLAGLFLGISVAGFWGVIGPIMHSAGLFFFVIGLGFSARFFWKRFFWPSDDEIRRALERKNNAHHRPFRSLGSVPLALDEQGENSQLLWALHQDQQQKELAKLKPFWPDFSLGNGDVFSFRAAVLLGVLSGFMSGGGQAADRLSVAFLPKLFEPLPIIQVDIWASPPDYTALAPVLLTQKALEIASSSSKTIQLPEGSRLIVQVSGGGDEPPIFVNGDRTYNFLNVGSNNFHAEIMEISSGRWHLFKDGDEIASWHLQIIPDLTPIVHLQGLPTVTKRKALHIGAIASDDYGVLAMSGVITRVGESREIKFNLPFPQGSKAVESRSYHDLTAHPWSGLPVELALTARDELGHVGRSKSIRLTLPERVFHHPVARVLISERKKLVADPVANKMEVVGTLSAILSLPEALNGDLSAALLISVARGVLFFDRRGQRIDETAELMWFAALKLENGGLNTAETALRHAENALMAALSNGADDAEIKRLVAALKEAMQGFLAELSKNQHAQNNQFLSAAEGQQLAQQDLNNLLDKIDQFASSGAREMARNLLSQLQDILENIQATGSTLSASQIAGQKMLDTLTALMGRQKDLMDDTLQSSRRSEPSRKSSPQSDASLFKGLGDRQEALRQMLGDLMGALGLGSPIPHSLGKAERAMNKARQALEIQQPKSAENAQIQAMEQLRQGMENMMQQIMPGQGAQGAGQFGNTIGRDPLGRPVSSQRGRGQEKTDHKLFQKDFLSTTKLILEEVRRRLSDPNRSPLEKQYLKRLLERFN